MSPVPGKQSIAISKQKKMLMASSCVAIKAHCKENKSSSSSTFASHAKLIVKKKNQL